MHSTIRYVGLILALHSTAITRADQPSDPREIAAAVAPYLDAQTIAVGHVNLKSIDPAALVDQFVQLVPEAREDHAAFRDQLGQAYSALIKAGLTDLYLVVSLADVPANPPFVIAPTKEPANIDSLKSIHSQVRSLGAPLDTLEQLPGAVFLGSESTLKRLKSMPPHPRPELIDALQAVGDSSVQVVVMPSNDDRRVVEELLPTLPDELGGGPSTVVTRGALWIALGMDAPPNTRLKLVIQSADQESAEALRGKWLELTQLLSRLEETPKRLRGVGDAMKLLTPDIQGDRLVRQFGNRQQGMQALLGAFTPPIREARIQALRRQSMNHLKQLALAMHTFYDSNKRFPAIGTFDSAGKPLLSWRVHLLRYVEGGALYKQFRLDEPWDSDHNRKLIGEMPELFRSPASKLKRPSGLATYRLVVGEHTAFPGREGIELKQITDGTVNTIMVVEVDDEHAVEWTRPAGLPYNEKNPAEGLGGQYEGGFHCAFCDGSAHFLALPHDPERLRRLLLRDDGLPIPR